MGAGILVFNAGSSSLKFALFAGGPDPVVAGVASQIGGCGGLVIDGEENPAEFADHGAALAAVLAALEARGHAGAGLAAVAHRVVHGGDLATPARLDQATLAAIRAASALAPLHNPPALTVIEAMAARLPEVVQTASFDTAFHATIPEVARRYALPEGEATRGLRRYGFHGISYASLVRALPRLSGGALPRRLLAFHLGAGASACAILDGRSVATTMGFSPLDGLSMASRCGDISPEAVLELARRLGIAKAGRLLWHDSGLKGLSGGCPDMRRLLARADDQARFAVAHFAYWAARHAGSLAIAMGGVDAVAFTGGIGEHAAPVRAAIMAHLAWLGLVVDARANAAGGPRLHGPGSAVQAWVVPAREERAIAADAARLLGLQEP